MAVKASGSLALSEIASEFGDSQPHSMSEFIRGGAKVPQADANNNIPTSTANMRFNNFFGAVNVIALTATSGTNVSLASAFGSNWTTDVPKEYIVPSGVTLGATSTTAFALTVESNLVGTLTIKNSGSIEGAGGAAGAAGGDAIDANATCTIINNSGGSIKAGGGGGGNGGAGGTGGAGGNGYYVTTVGGVGNYNSCNAACQIYKGGNHYCYSGCNSDHCNNCAYNTNTSGGSGGAGGAGGAGGVGEGYGQSAGSGVSGVAGSAGSSGGSGSGNGGLGGTGGAGGAGGAFGAAGTAGTAGGTGNTGSNGNTNNGSVGSSGSSGGSAGSGGRYINGIANVTLTNNGTVAGTTV